VPHSNASDGVMKTLRRSLTWLLISVPLAGCGLFLSPSEPAAPPLAGPAPQFQGSVGQLKWVNAPGLSDVLEALPPQASAEALLNATAERIREARPGEDVRVGWFLAPVGESAGAWVQLTGLEDDSIAGEELRLEMEGVGGVWRVVLVESSTHCRRGVDQASQLCV